MRAHIFSIGSELISGQITDTNATFLAQELIALGIELLHVTQVGDDRARIAGAIQAAMREAHLVVCTGGVGPTEDDLTREAIADVAGETPAVDPGLLAVVEAFFAARGLVMPERNQKQAWLIPSAEALPNPVGTAPGWYVTRGSSIIIAMPGVPREMTRMWRDQVVPRLQPRLPARFVRSVTLKTLGIGESAAEQLIADLVLATNPIVATYAKDDGVHVRVTGIAGSEAEALTLRDTAAAEVRGLLGDFIYGADDVSLPAALGALLERARGSLAVADAGGGGRFAALLLSDPVAATAVVSASARPFDGVTAASLATDAARVSGATIGVGIAVDSIEVGPAREGTIRVALSGGLHADESFGMRSSFEDLQRRSALTAADVLRRGLLSLTSA